MPFVNIEGVDDFFDDVASYADGLVVWGDARDAYSTAQRATNRTKATAELEKHLAGWESEFKQHCAVVQPLV